ncbi:13765_t:CDS:1, partial [Dentiscutata erythropus]
DSEKVKLANLTVPIISPKQLVDIAKTLKEQYYFFCEISAKWIQIIPRASAQPGTPLLPTTVKKILEKSESVKKPLSFILPITMQEEVEHTVNFLKEHFNFADISTYIINIPDLPKPQ